MYTNQNKARSKFLTSPGTVNRLMPQPLSRHLSCSMIDKALRRGGREMSSNYFHVCTNDIVEKNSSYSEGRNFKKNAATTHKKKNFLQS